MTNSKKLNEEDELDPRARYKIFGFFDEFSYDDDLERFPDCYDANGWPLYGEYDRYALQHPFTKQSWHLAPRLPTSRDTPEYECWFIIADTFIEKRYAVLRQIVRDAPQSEAPAFKEGVYCRYEPQADAALPGNLRYLQENLVPALEPLIANREATAELVFLWGEFCSILSDLPASVSFLERQAEWRAKQEQKLKSAKGGSADSRQAQRKWYLHCRKKYCGELKKPVRWLNARIKEAISRISNGELPPPQGWRKDWFQAMCTADSSGKDKETIYLREFTDALRKVNTHPDKDRLLAQAPEEPPAIPPTDLSLYGVDV